MRGSISDKDRMQVTTPDSTEITLLYYNTFISSALSDVCTGFNKIRLSTLYNKTKYVLMQTILMYIIKFLSEK